MTATKTSAAKDSSPPSQPEQKKKEITIDWV